MIHWCILNSLRQQSNSYRAVLLESHFNLAFASPNRSQTHSRCSYESMTSLGHSKPKTYSGMTYVSYGQLRQHRTMLTAQAAHHNYAVLPCCSGETTLQSQTVPAPPGQSDPSMTAHPDYQHLGFRKVEYKRLFIARSIAILLLKIRIELFRNAVPFQISHHVFKHAFRNRIWFARILEDAIRFSHRPENRVLPRASDPVVILKIVKLLHIL